MALPAPLYYCHACRAPQHHMRCSLCGRDCDPAEGDQPIPAPSNWMQAPQAVGHLIMYRMPGRPWSFYGSAATLYPLQSEDRARRDADNLKTIHSRTGDSRYEFTIATVTVPS